MKLTWKVRNDNGDLLFQTRSVDDTPENRQRIGKTLRRQFPSADGYSVARVRVSDDGTEDAPAKSHTVILAVDCGPEGSDIDEMIADMRIADGVIDVRNVARHDHDDDPGVVSVSVDLPAATQ